MKTLFIGQNAVYLTAVNSTNSYATEMLRQISPVEGTIIYTFEQTNGRGQRGNTWQSEPAKNVAFSLILNPLFLRADEQFLLTKITSLAVADLMAENLKNAGLEANVKVKWPNDIYIDGKKAGGILIENTIRENHIQHSVIGIGLNINQENFGDLNATSLKKITTKEFELQEIVERLCEFIEARYLQLKANKRDLLHLNYLQRLYQLNEWRKYRANDEVFEGKIVSVSDMGKLQLELHSTEIREFELKEIQFTNSTDN
ncbi:MAG: biotin--acetyl-CoA-carboxylase ligase [Bacteroidetes bacterium]|nr:biotin--acetyl-CoA-carboxylase ligase [Bacteroidota bacterium]